MSMDANTRSVQHSIAQIVRILKITEPSVRAEHGRLKFVPADVQTLRFLADHPGAMANALAQHLGVAATTATSIIDRLVKRGLVKRTRPETDRRSVSLSLTEAGRDAFSLIETEELQTAQLMLEVLEPEERDGFVSALARIAASLYKSDS